MTCVEVARPARRRVALPVSAQLRVAAPVAAAADERAGLGQVLLAGVGSLGMLGFALIGGNRLFLVVALLMLVATVGGSVGARRAQRRASRRRRAAVAGRWDSHLRERVAQVADAARVQRDALETAHPGSAAQLARARGGDRLWERRPVDPDALTVRLGDGAVPALVTLVGEGLDSPLADHDPGQAAEAAAAVRSARFLPTAPVVADLRAVGIAALVGPSDVVRALARAVLAELLVSCPPGELAVAVAVADARRWQWLAWVPHDVHVGFVRAEPTSGCTRLTLAEGQPAATTLPAGPALWLCASAAEVPGAAGLVVEVAADGSAHAGDGQDFAAAALSTRDADEIARALAPLRLPGRSQAATRALDGDLSLLGLLGAHDVGALDVAARWAARRPSERLRVPLGVDGDGEPVHLDLREAAEGGDGPHGLVVGATGSGKSELLRAAVLALALGHPPDELALLLVDWKGGASFADVCDLPHVVGLATNLADGGADVERVTAALRGELERRQRALREVGADSLRAYAARCRAGEPLPALPTLVVVVDEFGELLAAEPGLLDVLSVAGRLGRSLGVHLVLASQRLEEGRLRGLDSHLRYRICLRVLTAGESHAVLGVADAVALPAEPGHALLSVDGRLVRLRVAHTSSPAAAAPTGPGVAAKPLPLVAELRLGGDPEAAAWGDLARRDGRDGPVPGRGTQRSAAVARIVALDAAPAAPVWLPPLPPSISLAPLLAGASRGTLRLPVGRRDLPVEQRQPPWELDLADGHLAIVGAPGSGASTLLLSLGLAAAGLADPGQVQLAAIDLGGGLLAALDALPHTRCVAGPEQAETLLQTVRALVSARARRAQQAGLGTAQAWRTTRAHTSDEPGPDSGDPDGADPDGADRDGADPDGPDRDGPDPDGPEPDTADLLVLIDGVGAARDLVPDLDDHLTALAADGLRVGVHLVLTAHRWADLRPAVRERVAQRVELRLADAADSALRPALARALDGAPPGRGLTTRGELVQVADPTGYVAPAPSGDRRAPRLLAAPARAASADPRVLAIRAGDRAPVRWSGVGALLVLGERGSGRSTLLRRVVRQGGARILVIDPRRSLLAVSAAPGVTWTSGGADTEQAVQRLADELVDRLPRPGASLAELLRPSVVGLRHLVVVDDADLLLPGAATAHLGGPLAVLAPLLRRAEDVGLGLAVARGVAGWARSAYDPFLVAVQETRPTAVLLAGDPAEGPLVAGVRARAGRRPGRATWLVPGEPGREVQVAIDPPASVTRLHPSAAA